MRLGAIYVLLLFQCVICSSAVNKDQFDYRDGFRTGTDDYAIHLRNIGKQQLSSRQREGAHSHIIYLKAEDLIPLIRQGKLSAADLASLKLKESLFRPEKTPPVPSANSPSSSRSRWRFPDEKPSPTDRPPVFSSGEWKPTDPSTLKTLLSSDRTKRPLQDYQDPVPRPQPISVLHNYRYRPADPELHPDPEEKPVAEKPLVYITEKPEIQQDYRKSPERPTSDPLVVNSGILKDPGPDLTKLRDQDRYRPTEVPLIALKPTTKDPHQSGGRLQDQDRFRYSPYYRDETKEINPVKVNSFRQQDRDIDQVKKPFLSDFKPILSFNGVAKDQGTRYVSYESEDEQDQDRSRKPTPAVNPAVKLEDPSSRHTTKAPLEQGNNQNYYKKAPIPLLAPIVPLTGAFEDPESEELYVQNPYKQQDSPPKGVQRPSFPSIDPVLTNKDTTTNHRDQDETRLQDPVGKIVDIQGLKEFYGSSLRDQNKPKDPAGSYVHRPRFYGLAAAKILHAHSFQETICDSENFIPAVVQKVNPLKNPSRPAFPSLAILEPIQTDKTSDSLPLDKPKEIYSIPFRPGTLSSPTKAQNDPETDVSDPIEVNKRPNAYSKVPVVESPKTDRRPGSRPRIPPRKVAQEPILKDVIQQYEDRIQASLFRPEDYRFQPNIRPLPPSLKPTSSYQASYEDIVIPYDGLEDLTYLIDVSHENPESVFDRPATTPQKNSKEPLRPYPTTPEVLQDHKYKDRLPNPYKPAYSDDYKRPELPQGPVQDYPAPQDPSENPFRTPTEKDRLPVKDDFEIPVFPPLETVPNPPAPESQGSRKPTFPPLPILEPIQTDTQFGNPVFKSSFNRKPNRQRNPSVVKGPDPYSPASIPGFKTSLRPKVSLRPHGVTQPAKADPVQKDPAKVPPKLYFEEPVTSDPVILEEEEKDSDPYGGPVGPPMPGEEGYGQDFAIPTTLKPLHVDPDEYFRERNRLLPSLKPTNEPPTEPPVELLVEPPVEPRRKPVPRRQPKRKQKFDFTPKGPFPSPAPRPREPKNLEEGSLLSKYPLPAKQAAQDGFGKRIRPLKRIQLAGMPVSEPPAEIPSSNDEAVDDPGKRKKQRLPRVDPESSRAPQAPADPSSRAKVSPRPLVRSRGTPMQEEQLQESANVDDQLKILLEQLSSNPHMEFSLEIRRENPEQPELLHHQDDLADTEVPQSTTSSINVDEATHSKYSEILEQMQLEHQLELESQLHQERDEEHPFQDSDINPAIYSDPESGSDPEPLPEIKPQTAEENDVAPQASFANLEKQEDQTELPLLRRFPFRSQGVRTAEKSTSSRSSSKVFVLELNQGANQSEKSTVSGFKYTPKSRSSPKSTFRKSNIKRSRLDSVQPSDIMPEESLYSIYPHQAKLDKQLSSETDVGDTALAHRGEEFDDLEPEEKDGPLKLYLLRASLSPGSSEKHSYVLATDSLPEALEDPEGLISFLQQQQQEEEQ